MYVEEEEVYLHHSLVTFTTKKKNKLSFRPVILSKQGKREQDKLLKSVLE